MRAQYRWIWLLLTALLFSIWFVAPTSPASAAEKSIVWERFDVDIQVNEDGSFDVAEHQRIRFIGGTFREGYREIPRRNFGYLSNWSVTDADGNVYMQSSGGELPYTFIVDELGSRYMLRWFFPPTDRTQTFTLRYRVHEGLRYYPGGEQLWWKAVFGDRQFPVLESRARLRSCSGHHRRMGRLHQWRRRPRGSDGGAAGRRSRHRLYDAAHAERR